jgi:hypothetical protein
VRKYGKELIHTSQGCIKLRIGGIAGLCGDSGSIAFSCNSKQERVGTSRPHPCKGGLMQPCTPVIEAPTWAAMTLFAAGQPCPTSPH